MTQIKAKPLLFSQYFQHSNILKFLFFLSGACGLIYEMMWLRVFGLIFGNTTYAASVVLSGFMLGLGLGAFVFGKIADQHKNPLKLYAVLELGIGFYAFATPVLWAILQFGFVGFSHVFALPFPLILLVKLVVSLLFLFIPTFLMGGTLPVVVSFLKVQRFENHERIVASLYAINTFGAVLGVFLSGFILPPWIGVWQAVYLTGAVNLIVFFVVCSMIEMDYRNFARIVMWWVKDAVLAARKFRTSQSSKIHHLPLTLFGITGAVSMIYEIGWTRVLALTLGSSTYAFSVMLMTFLVGIAVGSWLFGFFVKFFKANLTGFGLIHLLVGCSGLMSLNFINDLPYYFIHGLGLVGKHVWIVEILRFALCSLVIIVPTLFMGAAFSCFVAAQKHRAALEDELGVSYFANTCGAIVGAIATGFILIPAFGIQSSLIGASWAGVLVAIASIWIDLESKLAKIAISGSCLLLAIGCFLQVRSWDHHVIASGLATSPMKAIGAKRSELLQHFSQNTNLYYKEGLESIVSVSRFKDSLQLRVNGKVDASNGDDSFNQYFLGHLPLFLRPDAKRVLVIGLGSGSTNAAVASHTVEQIDTVEIEQSVVEAAKFFSGINRNVLNDKRHRIHIGDGRNFLLTANQKYDVIISEPSNPWMAGIANLFSFEHYQLMKKRLEDRGVVCQWVHAYSMSQDDLKMIIRTFASSFDQVNLWTAFYPDLLLLGSQKELVFDFSEVKKLWNDPDIRNDFTPFGIMDAEGIFSGFWLNDSESRLLAGPGPLHTDNHPRLEFSAPKFLYQDTFQSNFKLINSFRSAKYPSVVNLNPPIPQNPNFHLALARGYGARTMLSEAVSELRLATELNADDVKLLTYLGIIEYKKEDYQKAKEYFLRAAIRGGDRLPAELCYYLGLVFKHEGAWRDASRYFAQAMKLEPENMAIVFELANSYKNENSHSFSVPLFETVLNSNGVVASQLRFNSTIGLLDGLSQIGTREQQIVVLEQALSEYPNILQFRKALGAGYEVTGQLDKAHVIFSDMVTDFPSEVLGYVSLAQIYERMGKPEETKRVIKALVKVNPSFASNPEIVKILNR